MSNREHNLKTGDRIEIQLSMRVNTFYLFTESKPDENGKRTPGIAEINNPDDLDTLIADLQMLRRAMND